MHDSLLEAFDCPSFLIVEYAMLLVKVRFFVNIYVLLVVDVYVCLLLWDGSLVCVAYHILSNDAVGFSENVFYATCSLGLYQNNA